MPAITREELLRMDGNTEESIAVDLQIWERDHEHKTHDEWWDLHRESQLCVYLGLQWQGAGMPHTEEVCCDAMYCPRHAPEHADELKVLAVHRAQIRYE